MEFDSRLFEGYENTLLLNYDDIDLTFPNTVKYSELGEKAMKGVLKANFYRDGELIQTYSGEEGHMAVIAATRLGKTTSVVIPHIISFAKQKEKRSMVIADPKGELYRLTSKTLEAEGYSVKLLNFRAGGLRSGRSECWNPLTPIFRKYKAVWGVEREVKLVQTEKGPRNQFNGKIYEDMQILDRDIEHMRTLLIRDVENEVETLAALICPTVNSKDTYWEDSARELLKAYLWAMLEDSREKKNPITEDTFSFNTMINIYSSMKDGTRDNYDDGGYFSSRGEQSMAKQLAQNVILNNASSTRKCITSMFNSKMEPFKESAMRVIMSCNSFEMDELTSDKPVAVFINFRDELKIHYNVISMFVQQAYAVLTDSANDSPNGKLAHPFYFILDEFGNFPQWGNFETTISACGGRNIFFILILQSYAQLNNVYGRDIAEIIKDNMLVHAFLGSNNPDTIEAFSIECGKFTRFSPLTALNGQGQEVEHYIIETLPLMTQSRLSSLSVGEVVITEANCKYKLLSKLERYYMCKEFSDLPTADAANYVCPVDPFDKRYTYTYKPTKRSNYDFD